MQHARQHFQSRGFARAVWPQETDELAFFDREVEAINRDFGLILAFEQTFERPGETGFFEVRGKFASQVGNDDGGFGHWDFTLPEPRLWAA